MKLSSFLHFSLFGLNAVLFKSKKQILGTIILTDKCHLTCKHCAVNNITSIMHPYLQIREEMRELYQSGVRILFLSGGETLLWTDEGKTVRDLVIEAKKMGFLIVNIVTSGTLIIDLPEADLILLSLDGTKENHDNIRSETYDLIIENIKNATAKNICLYMAINQINKNDIKHVCEIAKSSPNIKAVSFNFHTPYPGTEHLSLTVADKENCCNIISEMIEQKTPVFNLKTAFPYIIHNSFKTPCYQCTVVENGKKSICGRCISIKGLCEQCGYFFSAEYSLIFQGNIKVIIDMLRTYPKFI